MNTLGLLDAYLRRLEQRMRWGALARGAAILGAAALGVTVAAVLVANEFAFSSVSVTAARIAVFLAVAFALSFGLVLPLLRLNRRRAARRAEKQFPEFEQRLLTYTEPGSARSPQAFLELVADDALELVAVAEPSSIVPTGRIAAFAGAAAAAIGTLVWLTVAGPGFLGYGSGLLWAISTETGAQPFYDIRVFPGDKTVRRGGDQLITAQLVGFQTDHVRLFARYESASRWEEVVMQPRAGGVGFEFLFAGLPEAVDYYVRAGAVRSREYRLSVVDLPRVERIQVTYRFPDWMGREDLVEEDGGDLRAVEGTEAELLIHTDKPLRAGILLLDDGREVQLEPVGPATARGRLKIEKDGLYHVAVVEDGERVRLTEDYFIEAQKESAPTVRIRRPGRDYRASPIEEVTVVVEAQDDFGLRDVRLHYSVNGGEEKTVPLLSRRGEKEASGSTTLYLEDLQLVPGDLISMYAVARDARHTAQTDMFFIEARPFEREYTQSQQTGGGMMGAQQQRISERQKEIIAATWNVVKDKRRTREQLAEDGEFLSGIQTKLKEQAESLARRMKARGLTAANEEFRVFTENMEAAAAAMEKAAGKLGKLQWRAALPSEQLALRHLLRAESIFRQIQVARGARGMGGVGSLGRDLENLFDLELDTEKNQYETGQRASLAERQSREIDEALEKLRELARRQQELAEQQRRNQQTFQQRWEQEMLRREAEELRRRMEELSRQMSRLQRGSSRSQSAAGQSGMQSGATGDAARERRLQEALERLRQATEDMRRAASNRRDARGREAESQRAAERLREATELLGRLRRQEAAGQLDDIARRAQQLAERQREFADKLRELYKDHRIFTRKPKLEEAPPPDPGKVMELAEEKRQMAEELRRLERDMQEAVRDLAGGERRASARLREALGEMQQRELGLRMKYLSEWIRRGLGAYAWLREAPVTEGLERLAEQTREAQQALGQGQNKNENLEEALSRVERLRRELERLARGAGAGQQQQRGAAPSNRPGGQDRRQTAGRPGNQSGSSSGRGRGTPTAPGVPLGASGGPGRTYSAMNTGERRPNLPDRPLSPEEFRAIERSYREGLRSLTRLRGQVRENREVAAEVAELIQQMRRLDPSRFPGNPELVEKLRTQVLPGLEQLELRLRREVEGGDQAQVKSMLALPVPPGYADAVADYYRRLSETRK